MIRQAVAAALLACLIGWCVPAAAQPAPVKIDVIASQSGSFAFVGSRIIETLNVLQNLVNGGGGINGRPVQFVYSDDQSNAVVAVQLANAAIARGDQVLLGPVSAAACAAVIPLVAANGPLNYCLSPVTTGPPGGYTFTSGGGTAAIKAAAPQALLTCASGTIFGTVLHGMRDVGLDIPTAASSANMVYEQLGS